MIIEENLKKDCCDHIRLPVVRFVHYVGLEEKITYLHPREMQIMWHGRYKEIPGDELRMLKEVIINFIEYRTELLLLNKNINRNNKYETAIMNSMVFYNAWNIEYFIKRKEEITKESTRLLNLFKM